MNDLPGRISEINLTRIGKKYNSRWIFNGISLQIGSADRLAITGHNGSGKSTLLQIIAGYVTPSTGEISWHNSKAPIPQDQVYRHLSMAGPYIDLIDQFTLRENVDFFCRMKPLQPGVAPSAVPAVAGLEHASDTQVQNLSSGMRQKLKLTLAFVADTGLLLLDEPLSNLDESGYAWYGSMSEKYLSNRMVVVCSNQVKEETAFCNKTFRVENFR